MQAVTVIFASALVLSACAGGYNPQYQINEIMIVNDSKQTLRDVSIRAGDRVFSCANVAPLGICSDRFGKRRLGRDPVEIEWQFGSQARQSKSLAVEVPATFSTGLALRAEIQVDPQGEVTARFRQETPF